MIIVGISQNKNNEHIGTVLLMMKQIMFLQKGAKFFEFIGAELLLISKKYPIAPFKIIAGHDTTAGF
jgi:hypothetical protein